MKSQDLMKKYPTLKCDWQFTDKKVKSHVAPQDASWKKSQMGQIGKYLALS